MVAGLLALLTTLPARLLQKLLVLLLPHALAALFDQGAHGRADGTRDPAAGPNRAVAPSRGGIVGSGRGWCNGSTESFGVSSRGSNPRPRARLSSRPVAEGTQHR